jgi:hypothetical protein
MLSDLVNSMLDTAGLSKAWWGEALLTAFHVLNRVPNKNKEKTPYEEWVGRKPSLSYLRTWGCLVKVNIPIPKKRTLGPMLGEGQHSHPKETHTRTKDCGLQLSRLCSAEHW